VDFRKFYQEGKKRGDTKTDSKVRRVRGPGEILGDPLISRKKGEGKVDRLYNDDFSWGWKGTFGIQGLCRPFMIQVRRELGFFPSLGDAWSGCHLVVKGPTGKKSVWGLQIGRLIQRGGGHSRGRGSRGRRSVAKGRRGQAC